MSVKVALRNHPKVLLLLSEEGSTPKNVLDTNKEQGIKKKFSWKFGFHIEGNIIMHATLNPYNS